MKATPFTLKRVSLDSFSRSTLAASGLATAMITMTLACHRYDFPETPKGYREFAYVSNGGTNTVSVLDLVYLRPDRTLQVGLGPSGMAVNPIKDEVYVVDTGVASGSGSVTVIDARKNAVAFTIGVHRLPYFISVDAAGRRAYVANSGSNTVSVIDLDRRREVAVIATGDEPGMALIAPDMRSLVVTNRASSSVSIFSVDSPDATGAMKQQGGPLHLRSTFDGCPGATDAAILPDSSKAFVACSAGHQLMAINLAAAPDSWAARQNPSLMKDRLLALLDVGENPVHLTLKPDGGELFVSNFGSGTISEVSTYTNEVGGTYPIGNKPVRGLVSADNSALWVANFGADSLSLYSIDDGKLIGSLRTGSAPDALAFSADEHLLLAADAHSGDVSVIRTVGKLGPSLLTILAAGASPNAIVVKAVPAAN